MNFNSLGYILLLPCAAIVYRALPGKAKNVLLLIINYAFYMCWQPKYALLLLFITCLSYFAAIAVDKTERTRAKKLRLALFVILGFTPLFIYKYYNFFCGLIESALAAAGMKLSLGALDIVLPIGISFYSFQAVGYVIDVYRKKTPVEKDLLNMPFLYHFSRRYQQDQSAAHLSSCRRSGSTGMPTGRIFMRDSYCLPGACLRRWSLPTSLQS